MSPYEIGAWSVAALALSLACFVGLGGRALFGAREKPPRLMGRDIELADLDWLGDDPPSLLKATVLGFENGECEATLTSPLEILGVLETSIVLKARHVGYPLSSMGRWGRNYGARRARCTFQVAGE